MLTRPRDDGQVTLLVIGYVAIAAVLVLLAVDVSKVFLARRALSSVADSAALSAAQEIDRAAVYAGGAYGCGTNLPVDSDAATTAAAQTVADDGADLTRLFATVDPPRTSTEGGTARVALAGDVTVPFGRVIQLLLPGHPATVRVSVAATAASAVVAPAGC